MMKQICDSVNTQLSDQSFKSVTSSPAIGGRYKFPGKRYLSCSTSIIIILFSIIAIVLIMMMIRSETETRVTPLRSGPFAGPTSLQSSPAPADHSGSGRPVFYSSNTSQFSRFVFETLKLLYLTINKTFPVKGLKN